MNFVYYILRCIICYGNDRICLISDEYYWIITSVEVDNCIYGISIRERKDDWLVGVVEILLDIC